MTKSVRIKVQMITNALDGILEQIKEYEANERNQYYRLCLENAEFGLRAAIYNLDESTK